MAKDWLGNEYDVDDLVIYAAMSGRSVTMVLARVVRLNESGTVTVCPVKSSRWKQHYGKNYYIDNRTGKRIDPWRSDKHVEVEAYYVHKNDPTRTLSLDELHSRTFRDWAKLGETLHDYEYVSTQFKDYVERKHEPTEKVTIHITENIVKWTGELPEEEEG